MWGSVAIFICKNPPLILSPAPYPVILFLCFSFHPLSASTTPPPRENQDPKAVCNIRRQQHFVGG